MDPRSAGEGDFLVNRILVWAVALAVGLAMLLSLSPMPSSDAMPCRYRGWTHVVQHANGNLEADSRYHVMRGEPPTCPTNGSGRNTDSTWQDRQRAIDRERHGLDWPY